MTLMDDEPFATSERSHEAKKNAIETARKLFEVTGGRMRFTTVNSREKFEISFEYPKTGREEDADMADIIIASNGSDV